MAGAGSPKPRKRGPAKAAALRSLRARWAWRQTTQPHRDGAHQQHPLDTPAHLGADASNLDSSPIPRRKVTKGTRVPTDAPAGSHEAPSLFAYRWATHSAGSRTTGGPLNAPADDRLPLGAALQATRVRTQLQCDGEVNFILSAPPAGRNPPNEGLLRNRRHLSSHRSAGLIERYQPLE
jgi:hypothetical protein